MHLPLGKNKKALIIGVDGVPYSLLNSYVQKGVMPYLKEILHQGFHLHQMNASIPDVSSVSWTSFATGVNPGEHGIYGFTDLQPHSYSIYFPNSKSRRAPTFWEILGRTSEKTSSISQKYAARIERPYRSIILNLPHTYPAYPINGVIVSGFVAIDLRKAVYPESALAYLQSVRYQIDVEAEKAKEDKVAFMKSLFECFEIRKKAISHFFAGESWDLFFACITETDRLHHFFFNASNDKENPYYESFLRFYLELDKFIKYLYEHFVERYSEKGFFMILSDHGFAPVKKEVYINRFLEEKGFLVLNNEGNFYERVDNKTKAFNLDPCRIYVHEKDSYPRGTVRKDEKAALLEEIKKIFRTLTGKNGDEVIDKIYQKEEIYHGPYADRAPDLVCLPRDGYDLKGSLEKKEIFGHDLFAGMHTWHDAFCVLPKSIGFSKKPSVEHLTEHIIKYFIQ